MKSAITLLSLMALGTSTAFAADDADGKATQTNTEKAASRTDAKRKPSKLPAKSAPKAKPTPPPKSVSRPKNPKAPKPSPKAAKATSKADVKVTAKPKPGAKPAANAKPSATPSPTPAPSPTPSPTPAPDSQGAAPTATPAPAVSPTPATIPTALGTPMPAPEGPFLDTFPQLRKYVYEEPDSGFYFGLGVSPIGLLKDRLMFSLDFFQLHWMNNRWDWEILNTSFSATRAQSNSVQSTQFTLRSSPKLKIFEHLSIGPLVGYEFVSFPNITARLRQGNLFAPEEPFSSRGWIYGGMLTESFKLNGKYQLQINQVAYKQSYSTSETAEGWKYDYVNPDIRKDPSQIEANLVLLLEVCFLY